MKNFIWRILLKPGWYHITWNSGWFDIPDRVYWNGEDFVKNNTDKIPKYCDVEGMSIFVKRCRS